MKHSDVTGIPFKWLLGENNATQDPLPHTSLYQLHWLGERVLFIDFDPSVGYMCAVAGIKAKKHHISLFYNIYDTIFKASHYIRDGVLGVLTKKTSCTCASDYFKQLFAI